MRGGPRCPCCRRTTGPFAVGRVMKVLRVGGRLQPHAWTRCQRRIVGRGRVGWTCGWSWWSMHPNLVVRAKARPGFKLVRARQGVAVTRQDRKGGDRRG